MNTVLGSRHEKLRHAFSTRCWTSVGLALRRDQPGSSIHSVESLNVSTRFSTFESVTTCKSSIQHCSISQSASLTLRVLGSQPRSGHDRGDHVRSANMEIPVPPSHVGVHPQTLVAVWPGRGWRRRDTHLWLTERLRKPRPQHAGVHARVLGPGRAEVVEPDGAAVLGSNEEDGIATDRAMGIRAVETRPTSPGGTRNPSSTATTTEVAIAAPTTLATRPMVPSVAHSAVVSMRSPDTRTVVESLFDAETVLVI